ncbi:asparagine synthetase AsnH [Photobacterium aphoticum]|uniref:asparagine synthase (glutamine-hydrolyzing) n=1 Tax=Photobacterium aphoticum TaxID=754436 RepID=A0A090QQ04_9GAMM|nr:asparagine synthetase AsnH [Photobacterium aphoticum]
MCGISGIFNLHRSTPIDEALLKRINRLQQHRGPDDEGYYVDEFAALAHRRLSIIDLSGGHQPLFNEDNSVVVVFNGEIYNYRELAQELSALGHQFRTLSDTEVIVHAWEAWEKTVLNAFVACSLSQCGIPIPELCLSAETVWARSPCFTRLPRKANLFSPLN